MRRRLVTALLAMSAGAGAGLPLIAWSAPGPDLPDLRADAPERPILEPRGSRLLLRFDGFVTNVGQGPLDVAGNPAAGQMYQRVRSAGSLIDRRPVEVRYETADGHNHWHLMRVMRYSLRAGPTASDAEVAPGQKVGFCLVDSQNAPSPRPAPEGQVYSTSAAFNQGFCGVGQTRLTSLRMGVSVGWRDVYNRDLALQWVDVSRTAPGSYWLAAQADPEDKIDESDESNGMTIRSEPVVIPGYVATPVGPVAVPAGTPAPVTLTSRTVGAPAARAFRITRAPANGSLNVAVGQSFAGPAVTYTPRPGFTGTDSFAFVAVTGSGGYAPFPQDPPAATATVQVGSAAPAPTVAISGAPATVVAGTSIQLQAAVSGAPGGVTWSADAGTVDASGLFTAPTAVPAGGTVTVRATSTAAPAATAAAVIGVTPVPVPVPAPGTGPGSVTALPKPIAIKRVKRILLVRVTAPQDGRLAIAAIRGKRALRVCVRRATAGRRIACALRLPPRAAGRPVRVVVRLKAAGIRWGAQTVSRR